MKKSFLVIIPLIALLFFAGCRVMQVAPPTERHFSPYDIVYQTTLETLREYGVIVVDRPHVAFAEEGPGTIVAELPQSLELGAKTRTRIVAYVRSTGLDFYDVEIAVERYIDTSLPAARTAGSERPVWLSVARDRALEVKIHNEIWQKLAGEYLEGKKPLVKDTIPHEEDPLEYTEDELKLLTALNTKLSVDFERVDYDAVFEHLRKLADVNIVITNAAMDLLEHNAKGLTLKADDIELFNILNLIIENNKSINWYVKHNVILITADYTSH